MGFFSSLWDSLAGPDDVQSAVIEAVAATIFFDGEVSDEERGYAIGFVASMMEVDDAEADRYMEEGIGRIQGRDFDDILRSIAERLPEFSQRRMAFLASVGASRAEGGFFSWGEEELLDAMANHFGFSDDEREMITEQAEQIMDA